MDKGGDYCILGVRISADSERWDVGNEREGGEKMTPGFLFRGTEWEKVPFTKMGRLRKDSIRVGKMERLVVLNTLSLRCLCAITTTCQVGRCACISQRANKDMEWMISIKRSIA